MTALDERGVGFRSLRESIDTTTAGGRLVFHLFGALAQFEREIIRDRTVAGLAAARARGRNGGRPSKLTADQVRAARRLYDEREHTVEQIGSMFGVSRTSIYRALRDKPGPAKPAADGGAAGRRRPTSTAAQGFQHPAGGRQPGQHHPGRLRSAGLVCSAGHGRVRRHRSWLQATASRPRRHDQQVNER